MQRRQYAYWIAIGVSLTALIAFMIGWTWSVDYGRLGINKEDVINAGPDLRQNPTCEEQCDLRTMDACLHSEEVCASNGDGQVVDGALASPTPVDCTYARLECEKALERCMMLCRIAK